MAVAPLVLLAAGGTGGHLFPAEALAVALARRAVAVDPNNWESESVLAEVQNAFGQPEQSLETIAVAVALNRNNPSNDAVASEAAPRVADAGRARSLLEKILAQKESATLHVALAAVAIRLDDRVAALANARRALQFEPANAEALRLVATLGG